MTDRPQRDLDDIRRKWVPDVRLGVWEVTMERERLVGCTTSRQALQALRRFAADAGLTAEVALLPDASVGEDRAVVVTAAIAPLLEAPDIRADRVSEALHGEALAVLEERAGGGAGDGSGWLRVRMADGYHAWTHAGYVATGPEDWATDWIGRAGARSHGAELRFDDGRLRLPIGARLAVRRDGRVEAADGRIGIVAAGTVRSVAELAAEARLVAVPEWAWRWFGGAPYRWGGRTEWGIDCSGFVQASYAARGLELPRDGYQQALAGRSVPVSEAGAGYEAGDLLCFSDGLRVSHVALWAGAGRIVHAALACGGVASEDLFSDDPRMAGLRERLVAVRRLKP